MRRVTSMTLRTLVVCAGLFCAGLFCAGLFCAGLAWTEAALAEDAAEVIDGDTPAARVEKAAALAKADPKRLTDAFAALGDRKFKKNEADPHLDFVAAFAVQQKSRVLRLAALDAGARMNAEGLAIRLRPFADGENRLQTTLATEALGLVGGADEDRALLRTMINSPSASIAVRSCEALARIGEKEDAEAMLQTALTCENIEVADHATWAALDIYKKEKTLLGRLKKLAGKDDGGPVAIRRASIEAMLGDGAEPFKWGQDLAPLRKLLSEAPETIGINCSDSGRKEKLNAALAWIKEEMPGSYLLLRAAVISINWPGSPPDAHLDDKAFAICIPLSYTGQNERQLSYHLLRTGTVLFEKRIGHPYIGHRGWENAIFDTFDLCEIAGLYSAGRINRDQFMDTIIPQRPWGGN